MPEPFVMVTSNKSSKVGKKGLIIGSVVVLFLAISIVAGVFLVQRQQNISEKASAVSSCPTAEACPVAGEGNLLRSCNSISSGAIPQEISCSSISSVGLITSCGSRQYCCPSLGASWTTDISLCSTPSPTPTLTPTPTASSSATATAAGSIKKTATPSATLKVQTTPREVPVTGTGWPTIVGAGVGIFVIIGAILLAI
jgi:hypothetical protein